MDNITIENIKFFTREGKDYKVFNTNKVIGISKDIIGKSCDVIHKDLKNQNECFKIIKSLLGLGFYYTYNIHLRNNVLYIYDRIYNTKVIINLKGNINACYDWQHDRQVVVDTKAFGDKLVKNIINKRRD